MDNLLTAVSTKKKTLSASLIQEVENVKIAEVVEIESSESALKALKNQPSKATLDRVLDFLTSPKISLVRLEPVNAGIVHQLVNDTAPNYWSQLRNTSQAKLLARSLRNPPGIGHILTRLRSLVADSQQRKRVDQTRDSSEHIRELIELLEQILQHDSCSKAVLEEILQCGKNEMQKKLLWKEYLAQVASGRIVAITAEAEDSMKSKGIQPTQSWISDGSAYAVWHGRNLATAMAGISNGDESVVFIVELCAKSLTLGYTDELVDSILSTLLSIQRLPLLSELLLKLKAFEQIKYLNAIIAYATKRHLSSEMLSCGDGPLPTSKAISSVAGLLYMFVKDNEGLRAHLVSLLTRSSIVSITDSLALRRAIIASLAQDDDSLHTLLENSIKLFGDSMYVKHTPILQQESLAQSLAICSGYVQRTQPMYLTMMAKSSYHVNGMSTRMGASSQRARFLGIAVGAAISKMVDKPDLQLKFDLEGSEEVEAKWYEHLTKVDDKVGCISGLADIRQSEQASKKEQKHKSRPVKQTTPSNTATEGQRIVEILSEDEDDLMAYEKPDSDPEDEDDDPSNVNRNKPSAPVYIRDLIAGLRDQENYENHQLALATAASLIRRKANFGTEVIDHLDELATILTGLQDNLDLEDFAQKRQQALIAVLLAKPAEMADWFSRSFYSGDYSLSQRIAMLTTMGLGARELAGVKDKSTEDLLPPSASFPSKQLPPHLHKVYTENKVENPVAKISSSMAREMLSPIASQAADQLSGPNVLKVRTFSSRMEVEKKRQKPIPNALAKIVADHFFFPLTGRWWLQVRGNSDSIYSSAHLLPSFLQTLSLLMNASGPNTLALPQMTREFWDLLLSVRGLAANDKQILNALLFGFMMLLETNEDKERLATEQGKELMETQSWVQMVFRDLGAGSEEDERIRVLAAGVIVRCQEVVEKYQRRMVGAMMDY